MSRAGKLNILPTAASTILLYTLDLAAKFTYPWTSFHSPLPSAFVFYFTEMRFFSL